MSKKDSEYLINRKDNQYEVVIGLEVHAQVEQALSAIEPYLNRPGCSSIARWAQTLFERFSQMKAV